MTSVVGSLGNIKLREDEMKTRMVGSSPVLIKCPVCQRTETYLYDQVGGWRPVVVLCDPEEGGCENYFVVKESTVTRENIVTIIFDTFKIQED